MKQSYCTEYQRIQHKERYKESTVINRKEINQNIKGSRYILWGNVVSAKRMFGCLKNLGFLVERIIKSSCHLLFIFFYYYYFYRKTRFKI